MSRSADDRRDALVQGRAAEDFVAEKLVEAGWTLLERNWRGGGGELDLVARRDGRVRIIEVKARTAGHDSGLESITRSKQRRLICAAEAYLMGLEELEEVCFAVALVSLADADMKIEWIDDAFDGV